jgi:CRP/FNR family transcriptional regulator
METLDQDAAPVEAVLRRLESYCPLEDADRRAVRRLVGAPVAHRVGADLGDDGEGDCAFLGAGWACRQRFTAWGGRQIIDILLPGDPMGYGTGPSAGGLCQIVALTPGIRLDARRLRDFVRSDDAAAHRLKVACQAAERAEADRLRDHVVRLGAPTAYQATVHLLLELHGRLAAVGMVAAGRWPIGLTQEGLAETLGVGPAQMNRVLAKLRREGLAVVRRRSIETPRLQDLAAAAGLEAP